jgi:hypothetical protein
MLVDTTSYRISMRPVQVPVKVIALSGRCKDRPDLADALVIIIQILVIIIHDTGFGVVCCKKIPNPDAGPDSGL